MAYFVRATMRHGTSPEAAAALRQTYSAHQAVWDALTDGPDRRRDFIYRLDDENGTVLAVCGRPMVSNALWRIETKPYQPNLREGENLAFALRANATRRSGGGGRRHDVVFDAIRKAKESGKSIERPAIVQEAGLAWLQRQGTAHGFDIDPRTTRVDGHRVHEFRKAKGGPALRISALDFRGRLRVTHPQGFHEALLHGIGPAKGFGFGLLMVRRP